jgi:septal ring factor EnvC (AmiA/AmiB activator)
MNQEKQEQKWDTAYKRAEEIIESSWQPDPIASMAKEMQETRKSLAAMVKKIARLETKIAAMEMQLQRTTNK